MNFLRRLLRRQRPEHEPLRVPGYCRHCGYHLFDHRRESSKDYCLAKGGQYPNRDSVFEEWPENARSASSKTP